MDRNVLKEQVLTFIQGALVTANRNGMDKRQTAEIILDALETEPARSHIEMHMQVLGTDEMLTKIDRGDMIDWDGDIEDDESSDEEEEFD